MNTPSDHEPLAPDPLWVYTPGAGWHSRNGGVRLDHPPAAYAAGFEAGAYALAGELNKVWTGELTQAELFAILLTYRKGSAHPARGWKDEPSRG